jgi:hypothetical protein
MFFASAETNLQFEKLEIEQCEESFHQGCNHTTMTPFGVSHYTTFQGCACLNVSHIKLFLKIHNIFAYDVKI